MSDSSPDEFSYSMALRACSAGLWSGDVWSSENGWGAKQENTLSSPRAPSVIEREEEHEAAAPPCRGIQAIEVSLGVCTVSFADGGAPWRTLTIRWHLCACALRALGGCVERGRATAVDPICCGVSCRDIALSRTVRCWRGLLLAAVICMHIRLCCVRCL